MIRRVATGGHLIPEDVIRRRFGRSLSNLNNLYKPIVDSWYIYDGETQQMIDFGRK